MRDDLDDNPLAGIDLAAWQPPPPPAGLADAVVARLRDTPPAVIDPPSPRRWLVLCGVLAAAAAVLAIARWGVVPAPRDGHGDVIAGRPQRLELDGTTIDLDAGAELHWRRQGRHVTATQLHGVARWTVGDDDELVIDTGAIGASATARDASLRVEVDAIATMIVYDGHIKASGAGQTVEVAAGSTIEVRSGEPPRPPAERPVVGAAPGHVERLAACVALRTEQAWKELASCAEALRPFDAAQADVLAATAKREREAELAFLALQTAVDGGDSSQLRALAAQIPDDSVYAAGARAKLASAAPRALTPHEVEQGVQAERGKLAACSTASDKLTATLTVLASGEVTKVGLVGGSSTTRGCVRDIVSALRFRRALGGTFELAVTVGPPPSPCASMNVEDVVQQADKQFSAGYSMTALTLMEKALSCHTDEKYFRLAALFACRAHNVQKAKLYYTKVSARFQAGIVQACIMESIDLQH